MSPGAEGFGSAPGAGGDAREALERAVRCARCGHTLTNEREALSLDGAHLHSFSNPSGVRFEIALFASVPGAHDRGEPTAEATWFRDTAWVFAHCDGCGAQVGWRYTFIDRVREQQRFWALITDCITR